MARLPFNPIGMLKNITHSQLGGEDYLECSAAFLYILTLLTLRITIRKFIGFKRPRTREPFTLPFPSKIMGSGALN